MQRRKSYVPRRKTKDELTNEAKSNVKASWRDSGVANDFFSKVPAMKPKLLNPWELAAASAPEKASTKFFFSKSSTRAILFVTPQLTFILMTIQMAKSLLRTRVRLCASSVSPETSLSRRDKRKFSMSSAKSSSSGSSDRPSLRRPRKSRSASREKSSSSATTRTSENSATRTTRRGSASRRRSARTITSASSRAASTET